MFCDVCGLPFRPITGLESKTRWLNDAVMKAYGERVAMRSLEDYGHFVPRGPLPPMTKNFLEENENIKKDGTIAVFELLDENRGALCHEACEHRKDAARAKRDLGKVKRYQGQFLNDEGFLENENLRYLLSKPGKQPKAAKAPSAPKALERMTAKELNEVCEKLGTKRGKVKADTIKAIRDFVCPK